MYWCSITAFQTSAIIDFSHKNTIHHKEQLSFLVHSPSEKKNWTINFSSMLFVSTEKLSKENLIRI